MADLSIQIRPASHVDIPVLAQLISDAYSDVALRFGLTPQNCPKHPSNCTPQWIVDDIDRGVKYFILEMEGKAAGCAALEIPRPGECYLERLAVLPSYRHRGCGIQLVKSVFREAGKHGVRNVGIGIIGAQLELKHWYEALGFTEGETRRFEHLPFDVTFMSCPIADEKTKGRPADAH